MENTYLARILEKTKFTQLSLDREPGIERAALGAFAGKIKAGECHAFLVAITKNLGMDKRRNLIIKGATKFERYRQERSDLFSATDDEIKVEFLRDQIIEKEQSYKNGAFLSNPFHTITEPERSTSWITGHVPISRRRQARLHFYASLHSVDNLFNCNRRALSHLERSTFHQNGTWSGKSPYRPDLVQKLLDIHRAYFNFIKTSERDKKTPAMRMGLANAPLKVEDIMYFKYF